MTSSLSPSPSPAAPSSQAAPDLALNELEHFWRLVEDPSAKPGYFPVAPLIQEGCEYFRIGSAVRAIFTREQKGQPNKEIRPTSLNSDDLCSVRDASAVWKKVHDQRIAASKAALQTHLIGALVDLCIAFFDLPVPTFRLRQESLETSLREAMLSQQVASLEKLESVSVSPDAPGTALRTFDLDTLRRLFVPVALPIVPIQERMIVVLLKAQEEAQLRLQFEDCVPERGRWILQPRVGSDPISNMEWDPHVNYWKPLSDWRMRSNSPCVTLITLPLIGIENLRNACLRDDLSMRSLKGFQDRMNSYMEERDASCNPEELLQIMRNRWMNVKDQRPMSEEEYTQRLAELESPEQRRQVQKKQKNWRLPVDPTRDFAKLRLHPGFWNVTTVAVQPMGATDEQIAALYETQMLARLTSISSSSSISSPQTITIKQASRAGFFLHG
jgi:hypothetical protein